MLKKESSSELLLLELLNDLADARGRLNFAERNVRILMERVCRVAGREVESESEDNKSK